MPPSRLATCHPTIFMRVPTDVILTPCHTSLDIYLLSVYTNTMRTFTYEHISVYISMHGRSFMGSCFTLCHPLSGFLSPGHAFHFTFNISLIFTLSLARCAPKSCRSVSLCAPFLALVFHRSRLYAFHFASFTTRQPEGCFIGDV